MAEGTVSRPLGIVSPSLVAIAFSTTAASATSPSHIFCEFCLSIFSIYGYGFIFFFCAIFYPFSPIQNCNIYKFGMDNGHNLSTLLLRMRSTMLIQDIINWAMSTVSLKLSDGVPLHRPAQLSTPPPHMEHSVRALCRAPLSAV